jgi:hypothetical protein
VFGGQVEGDESALTRRVVAGHGELCLLVSQAARSRYNAAGRRFSEAGSQLPFPLRSDLGNLADRHGAGVPSTRPHLCFACSVTAIPNKL